MPQTDVSPTKSNYLEIEERLERAQEGYDLLEQKRQILVIQLMNRVEAAKRVKKEVDRAMEDAFAALQTAARSAGARHLDAQSCGITGAHQLRIQTHSVMGISVPSISCEQEDLDLEFAISDGESATDEVMKKFREALDAIAELAEVENAVFRLAREVKKTQRRVQALEKTFIPRYKRLLNYISDALEEREREQLVIMKKVQQRREADRNSPSDENAATE